MYKEVKTKDDSKKGNKSLFKKNIEKCPSISFQFVCFNYRGKGHSTLDCLTPKKNNNSIGSNKNEDDNNLIAFITSLPQFPKFEPKNLVESSDYREKREFVTFKKHIMLCTKKSMK